MSKVSFRARALDASRPMPVFTADSAPDLAECASINRSVPQMPTGMEKEEEMELHLQQAIFAQQALTTGNASDDVVIPIPRVSSEVKHLDQYCTPSTASFRPPKQYIKIQAALNLEPELPDYDMDSDDEDWLKMQADKMEILPTQFEKMMDRLEKQSEHQVVNIKEAKALLQEDDDLIIAVYDYWLNKRLKTKQSLIPHVRTEKRDGSTSVHPYVAFRRRAEKIQTRKNRKNDEESYEKMLKIRRDLSKAVTLFEMIKRREKGKREMLNLTVEVFERRLSLEDWGDEIYAQLKLEVKPSFTFSREEMQLVRRTKTEKRRKRSLKETRTDIPSKEYLLQNIEEWHRPTHFPGSSLLSVDDVQPRLDGRDVDEDPDGQYAFRRKRGCHYYSTREEADYGRWPWERPKPEYHYGPLYLHPTSGSSNTRLHYVGLCRRRRGRGGRVIVDRVVLPREGRGCDPITSQQRIPYFRPASPIGMDELEELTPTNSQSQRTLHSLSSVAPADDSGQKALLMGPHDPVVSRITVGIPGHSYALHRAQVATWLRQQGLEILRAQAASDSHVSPQSDYSQRMLDAEAAQFALSAIMNKIQYQRLVQSYRQPSPGRGRPVAPSPAINGGSVPLLRGLSNHLQQPRHPAAPSASIAFSPAVLHNHVTASVDDELLNMMAGSPQPALPLGGLLLPNGNVKPADCDGGSGLLTSDLDLNNPLLTPSPSPNASDVYRLNHVDGGGFLPSTLVGAKQVGTNQQSPIFYSTHRCQAAPVHMIADQLAHTLDVVPNGDVDNSKKVDPPSFRFSARHGVR